MSRLSIIILLSLQALAMAADDVTHTGDAEAPAITTPPSAQELVSLFPLITILPASLHPLF